jgi:hypothetical protein
MSPHWLHWFRSWHHNGRSNNGSRSRGGDNNRSRGSNWRGWGYRYLLDSLRACDGTRAGSIPGLTGRRLASPTTVSRWGGDGVRSRLLPAALALCITRPRWSPFPDAIHRARVGVGAFCLTRLSSSSGTRCPSKCSRGGDDVGGCRGTSACTGGLALPRGSPLADTVDRAGVVVSAWERKKKRKKSVHPLVP